MELTLVTLVLTVAQLSLAQEDLFGVLNLQPDLSSFRAALNLVPDLALALANSNNITILAPVDSAFVALSPNTSEGLAVSNRDPDGVAALLAYHVLRGNHPSSAVTEVPTYIPTLLDSTYRVSGVARANVTGGQHVGAVRNGSNVSFLCGDLAFVTVTKADIAAGANVTIHKVDRVLRVPNNASATLPSVPGALAGAGALRAAGLLAGLDVPPGATLFVPSVQAFQAAGSVILGADAALLRRVMQYHVANGTVVFASGAANASLPSLLGGGGGRELTLSVVGGDVFVDSARVVVPNIILSGGVAHIIDTVLNPDAAGGTDRNSLDPKASPTPAFTSASLVAVTPFASGITPTTTLSIPAVLTTGPVVSATSTRAATTLASAAAASAAECQLAIVAGALMLGALLG